MPNPGGGGGVGGGGGGRGAGLVDQANSKQFQSLGKYFFFLRKLQNSWLWLYESRIYFKIFEKKKQNTL